MFIFRVWQYVKTVLGIIFRHPITGVTLVPILPDGRIVLVRRSDSGKWGLPGGIIDWGEKIATAAHRELAEETGLTLTKIGRLVGAYSDFNRDPRIHSITITLAVEAEGELRIKDVLEISEVHAFFPEKIPFGKLAHDHDRLLRDYFAEEIIID